MAKEKGLARSAPAVPSATEPPRTEAAEPVAWMVGDGHGYNFFGSEGRARHFADAGKHIGRNCSVVPLYRHPASPVAEESEK